MRSLVVRAALATTAAAVTVTAVAVALPAEAATTAWIDSATVSPASRVIKVDSGCADRFRIDVTVHDPDAELGSADLSADVTAADGSASDFVLFTFDKRTGDKFTAHGDVFICGNLDDPGRYTTKITLEWFDADDNLRESVRTRYFSIQRPTSLTYNASPEPVKKGKTLTHSGQLKYAPYGYGSMYGPSGVKIEFFFKKDGTSTYVSQGSVTTGSGGQYAKKITATASGTWKAVFAGNSSRQPQTKYDGVAVS